MSTINILVMILEFIISLGILIFIHELGHYLAARWAKIEVEEFGFGFPPRIVKLFEYKGTEFTLNWIPFGAFVRPKGENDPDAPGGLAAANPFARLMVLFAGPLMNLLAGILLFSLVFMRAGAADTKTVQIFEITANSPAQSAGLMAGDVFKEINDTPINSISALSTIISQNKGKEIAITYLRSGEEFQTQAVPRVNPPEGEGSLGIVMGNPVKQVNFFQAIPAAVSMTLEQARQLFMTPVRLILGQLNAEEARFIGPINIFNLYQNAREMDDETTSNAGQQDNAVNTLWLMGVVSVAFGITNLLPIPALDGGRILFIIPELIFRKRVPAKYENFIHFVGFVLLIGFMIYVTFQDIFNPITIP